MKFKKILPAAAGVIALTSSIAFADGNRGPQEASLRVRVSDCDCQCDPAEDTANSFAIGGASGSIYRVSIMHGETTKVVLIDAQTGWVIRGA
jgi:hypothetical protein